MTGYVQFGQHGQRDYKQSFYPGLPGQMKGMGAANCVPYLNLASGRGAYHLDAPAGVDADTTYLIYVGGRKLEISTTGVATADALITKIYDAMRLDARIYGDNDIRMEGSSRIVVEPLILGRSLEVSVRDADTFANGPFVFSEATPPTLGKTIPFGRFVATKSTYYRDRSTGYGAAALPDSTTTAAEIVGIAALGTQEVTETARGEYEHGWRYGNAMNVMANAGSKEGIWVESENHDIRPGDTVYVKLVGDRAGAITKTATGNLSLGSDLHLVSGSEETVGAKFMALVRYK